MFLRPAIPFLIAGLLACGLLPSCLQWNIGRNIREGTVRYAGVNTGTLYELPPDVDSAALPRGGGKARGIYLAEEVSYRPDYPIVSTIPHLHEAGDVQPTGACRPVRFPITIFRYPRVEIGERVEVDARRLRPHAGRESAEAYPIRPLHPREVTRSAWYWPATLAAAPFDYLIDPALSLTTTPFYWLGSGVLQLFPATSTADQD